MLRVHTLANTLIMCSFDIYCNGEKNTYSEVSLANKIAHTGYVDLW